MRFCRHRGVVTPTASNSTPEQRRIRGIGIAGVLSWLASMAALVHSIGALESGRTANLLATALLIVPAVALPLLLYGFVKFVASAGAIFTRAADMGMYELETRIAMGGMGEVWRARHRLLSRPAAVKLIRTREEDGQGTPAVIDTIAQQRFEREAQVTASLKSPHTVELYDFGVTKTGTIYYVMELLEGDDLEQRVKREGPFEPARVVHILEQALDSLAEAHRLGLVHRDIKPANLHISERGLEKDFVKVLDFGLVKRSKHHPTDNSLSHVNTLLGTPAYLAPEAITLASPVDARADIYSLGCVAYYLLTGHRVFEADTVMGMAVAHVTAKPVPPSKRAHRAIPEELERIVLACLEKSPERRPQSAIELLDLLKPLALPRGNSANLSSGTLERLPSSPLRELVRAVN
jgi:serine/threonine-protein kinase